MSKENHEKFYEEIRAMKIKISEMEEEIEEKKKSRNIVDHLYIDDRVVLSMNRHLDDPVEYEYMIYCPSNESFSLSTENIVEICSITKVNRKSLKKVWVDELGGILTQLTYGETVRFTKKETAEKALDWLISRIVLKELSK